MGYYEEFIEDGDYAYHVRYFDMGSDTVRRIPKDYIDTILHYDKAKEHLSLQLMDYDTNRELLENVPHERVKDMAAVYRITQGEYSTIVTNQMLKEFGKTQQELHFDAMTYAPINQPVKIESLYDLLAREMGMEPPGGESPIYVATTENGKNGASVICYPGFLAEAADALRGDYYILPSSKDEVLMVPDVEGVDGHMLKELVGNVNQTHCAPWERLTDNAYHYDRRGQVLETVEEYEVRRVRERTMARENVREEDGRVEKYWERRNERTEKRINECER